MVSNSLLVHSVTAVPPLSSIKKGLRRRFLRAVKALNQRITIDQSVPKQPVFIVGCQRCGTSMMLELLDQSPSVFVYGETDSPVMQDYRIAPPKTVESVIRRSHAKTIVFKPICDSHWTDRLLRTYSNSKAIWMYRDFGDMVNSSLRKWTGQLESVTKLVQGDLEPLGWRAERVTNRDLAIVKDCFREGLTRADAAALQWLLRTGLYVQLKLYADPRVLLVKYDQLVLNPVHQSFAVFDFLGIDFREEYASDVYASSYRKRDPIDLSPRVYHYCSALLSEMDGYATRMPCRLKNVGV